MRSVNPASILWRRLDSEGHDACRLARVDEGFRLEGFAAFGDERGPCGLAYVVECDATWHTRAARVTGSSADQPIDLRIARTELGGWLLNGAPQPAVDRLLDVDLGFTPATNLIAIRRLDLAIGETSPAPAVYLTFPELGLERLEQTYQRLDELRYRYIAPAYSYDDVITVSPIGFVVVYPGLWQSVM
jgi:hypothetical protein